MVKKAKKKVARIKSDLPIRYQKTVTTKKKRKSVGRRRTHQHSICDGEVTLFRDAPSGDVFQFQMWISKEKKYINLSNDFIKSR